LRKSIIGIEGCCARAESGHVVALPSSATTSRLHIVIRSPLGAQQEGLGDFQAERLGGPEVDDKVELGRLFDRKIARLLHTKVE
jgi:hypothetical protein